MDILIDPYRYATPSIPTITLEIVAADGRNADEGISGGLESLIKVGSEVWWNGNFGLLGLKARITDPFVDEGYPGPTNVTNLPNAFSAYWLVYDGTDVWTYSSPVPGGPRVSRINAATKAVTVYTGSQEDINFYVDNSNNLWRSFYIVNPVGPGRILSPSIEQVDKTAPVGLGLSSRTFTYGPYEVVFVGTDCFATASGNAPYGIPQLEKVNSSNVRTIIDLSAHMTGRPFNMVAAPDRGSIFMWGVGAGPGAATGKLVEVDAATGAIVKATLPTPDVFAYGGPRGRMVYDQASGVLIFPHLPTGSTTTKVYAVSAATGLLVAEHTVTIPNFYGFTFGVSGEPVAFVLTAGQVLHTAVISPTDIDPIYYDETVVIRIRYTP